MRLWIEHPVEPRKLILAWQAPDGVEDRRRWAVGALSKVGQGATFRYYSEDELPQKNSGRTVELLKDHGFAGYPAFRFELGKVYSEGVIETFERRLPPPSRSDFPRYLEYFSILPSQKVSTFTLLGLTEARLPGDGFSLVDPLDPTTITGEVTFEIAGYRHEAAEVVPEVGALLRLVPDPTNVWDNCAVAVYLADVKLGYVNRIQAPSVGAWLGERKLECRLLRFNGRRGAPRAYALLRVDPAGRQLAA